MRSKKAIYNIFSNLILQLIMIIYGFVIPKIIISSFGSNVNGLVSSITQFLAYITLLESGFGPVIKSVLYKPIANKDRSQIVNILKTSEIFFRKIAFIFLIYIIILCMLYPMLVSNQFSDYYTISLIVIIGISTFAEYFFGMTYRLYLQAEQKNYIISIIQIITYVIAILFVVLLAKINASIQVIKLVSGIVFIFRPIMQNIYVKKRYNIKLSDSNEKFDLKQKWDGLGQHIAAVIHGNTDITILTFFSTLAEVSVYSVYSIIIKGLKSIIQSVAYGVDAAFGDMIAKKEHENLNNKFAIYEVLYNSIITIFFSSTLILIIPFVSVYTKGVTDANYIKYTFATLIVVSEYIWAIRLPYSTVTLAAGHFKETKMGAWAECLINIIISIILVKKLGMVGVAIGTIVAMSTRTIEFVYHTNKYILDRSMSKSVKKMVFLLFETLLIVFICNYLPLLDNNNYIEWLINAFCVTIISTIITFGINSIVFKKEFIDGFSIIKRLLKKT